MSDYLDDGVVINILQRLPIKTLLRCTAVCKSWYSLITSPQFISSHLKFSASLLLARRCIRNSERYELYSDTDESFTRLSKLEFPFRSNNSFFTIVGSRNGLLCLSDDRVYYMHTIILWNPCVKKSILLPKPNQICNSHGTFMQSLGFGFDVVGCDYKVVRITYVDYFKPQVEVYKLSTGFWQDMSYLDLEYVIYSRSRQAYLYGATHWIARYSDFYDLIVLFDMSRDVFGEIMLPIHLLKNETMIISKDLMVYNDEYLALVLSSSVSGNLEESSFCVWVMKEYGVVESWSRHLSFDFRYFDNGGFIRPLWIRRNGEVIAVLQDGRLISFDRDEDAVKNLGVNGSRSEDYRRSIHFDSFTKSLVLLERGLN